MWSYRTVLRYNALKVRPSGFWKRLNDQTWEQLCYESDVTVICKAFCSMCMRMSTDRERSYSDSTFKRVSKLEMC